MVCVIWLKKTTMKPTHYPLICLFYGEQYTTTHLLILDSRVLNIHTWPYLLLDSILQSRTVWCWRDRCKRNLHGLTWKRLMANLQQSSTLNNLELPLTKLLGGTVSYSNVSCRHTCYYYSFFKKNDVFIIIKWMDSFALSPLWKQTKIWDINAIVECSQLIVKNQQLKIAKSPQVLEVKNWKEKLGNLTGQNFWWGQRPKNAKFKIKLAHCRHSV